MTKNYFLYVFLFLLIPFFTIGQSNSFYNYTVQDIDGNSFSFDQLEGKKVMIVNVASKCGFTSQYEQLEEIYSKYRNKNFVIIGFPANNFMRQEPGTNEEIKSFCTMNYGVTFPMMSKISVKGNNKAPIYQWLTQEELNGKESSSVKWNFQKYLINADGQLEKVVSPSTKPNDPDIIEWIEL